MLKNRFKKYSIAINQSAVQHTDLADSYSPTIPDEEARTTLRQRRPLDDGAVVGGVLLDDFALLDVAVVDHLLEQPPR